MGPLAAEGIQTGDVGLVVSMLVLLAGFLGGVQVRSILKKQDDHDKGVALLNQEVALLKQNKECAELSKACSEFEKKVAIFEKDLAITNAAKLGERVTELERAMQQIDRKLDRIVDALENPSGRYDVLKHPRRRHDDARDEGEKKA